MPAAKKLTSEQVQARAEYHRIPRRPKAEDPERFVKTPHEYGDILITGQKLGGALQRDLIYWIERHTWGANVGTKGDVKRPEYAKLSLGALARLCGGAERKNVAVALADLETRGIIASRDRKGCGATTAKMYKLTPEKWEKAKPYAPPTAKEIAAAESAAEESPDDEIPPSDPQTGLQSVVEPGKVSKPQPLPVKVSKDGPAVLLRVSYRSSCPYPLTFSARAGANGRIQVTAAHHDHHANCSRTQPQFAKTSVETKRFSEFDSASNRLTLRTWTKEADRKLVEQIVKAAGNASAELFEDIASKKLSQPGAGKKHTSGLLIALAQEASRSHERIEQQRLDWERKQSKPADDITPREFYMMLIQAGESEPKAREWSKFKGQI